MTKISRLVAIVYVMGMVEESEAQSIGSKGKGAQLNLVGKEKPKGTLVNYGCS